MQTIPMKKVSIYLKLFVTFLFFLGLTMFVHGEGKTDLADKILTVTSFVFGVILAFAISNRNSRLSSIKEKLREQDAKLLEIYYLSKGFNKELAEDIKKRIDEFLIIQLDYKLEDYNLKVPEKTRQFFMFLEKLKLKGKEDKIRQDILGIIKEIIEINSEVAYQIENKMAFYEWLSLEALAFIIFFVLIFYFNTNDAVSIIIISVVCTALCLLMFVLSDLNKLEWQEENWIWNPLSSLFVELDLIPYFPADVFDSRRLSFQQVKKWAKVSKIRIAHYPHLYPDMRGKTIEIIKLKD